MTFAIVLLRSTRSRCSFALALALAVAMDAGATSRRRVVMPPAQLPPIVVPDGLSVFTIASAKSVPARGMRHFLWEIVIWNQRATNLTLTDVTVSDRGETLLSYGGAELRPLIANLPFRPDQPRERMLANDLLSLNLWLSIPEGTPWPQRLEHTIHLRTDTGDETISGIITKVSDHRAMRISPPLAGGWWWAANGPSNDSFHRRALILIDGRLWISQRLATDWVKIDDRGSTWSGDWRNNASYYAYGSDLLAVADGVVIQARDGMAENIPGQLPPVSLDTAAGNFVTLDIGGGRKVVYAHIKTSTVAVEAGQWVARGTVLGKLGNSGNSTEPHLHFHICEGDEPPLACNGLPYVFDEFETASGVIRDEIPLVNDRVRFR